jgi:peptidase M28-like protein
MAMADPVETRRVAAGRGAGWGFPLALALLALVLLLVVSALRPPRPRPESAPPAEFSAARAERVLRDLVGDGAPHPIGSAANARVRDRVLATLTGLGYAPEVQTGFACNSSTCGRVENVLARLPGSAPGRAVLLASHYDSVGSGPGASDDLTGVAAVLEVARALKAGPPPRDTVLFLLDDGEEAGLLGAFSFVRQSPAAAEVGAVVNLEARGTSGASLMFETSGDNGWLVSRYAAAAPHPTTSSVYPTIYEFVPNDTDLSVFKRNRVPGLNFAFIRDVAHYHTPLDDLAHASERSLQHHGDNALAAVRGLAGADLSHPPRGNAVFFDLLGAVVVRWPAAWSLPLALLALLLVVAAVVLAVRRGALSGGALALGLAAFLGMVAAALAIATALRLGLLAGALLPGFLARPLPVVAAFWFAALAGVLLVAAAAGPRLGLAGLWAGAWLWWAVLGAVLARLLPGLSYLFLMPALVAGAAGLAAFAPRAGSPRNRAWAAIVPAVVAALLWFPVVVPLYDGLGATAFLVIPALLALLFTALAPLAADAGPLWRRAVPGAAVALTLVFSLVGLTSPPYSQESPQRVGIQFHQDGDSGRARWLVRGALPPAMRRAAPFDPEPQPAFPWSGPARAFAAPAPPLAAPAPALAVVEDAVVGGKRHLKLRLTSPRGAAVATVVVPAAAKVESVAVEGTAIESYRRRGRTPGPGGDGSAYSDVTLPPGGAQLDFVLGETAPLDWYVVDSTPGLPPGGQALVAARPATATAFQDGDATLVSRKVRI